MNPIAFEGDYTYSLVLPDRRAEVEAEWTGVDFCPNLCCHRQVYAFTVRTPEWDHTINGLCSPTDAPIHAAAAWLSGVHFLLATYTSGDGADDLFPAWLLDAVSPFVRQLEEHAGELEADYGCEHGDA